MTTYTIQEIPVHVDDGITEEETTQYVEDEVRRWREKKKQIARIELKLAGDEVIIKAVERSPIRRVRRITGYLSTVDRFNDAKLAELKSRVKHI